MKSTLKMFAALCILCTASALAADPGLSEWSHVSELPVPTKPAQGLVEVALTPELFAIARPDQGDLRLTTPSGQTVPYVLHTDRGVAGRSVSYTTQLLNPVFVPHQHSTVTVDFGSRAKRTRVDVDTPGTNFRRKVMVEASQDNESWQVLLKTAWLFRIAYATGSYSKNEIALPENDFRYLRITVFNAPDDPEQINIQQVQAWYSKSEPPKTVDVATRSVAVTNDAKLKATLIDVDLGHENLPLDSATFSFDDPSFLRRVEVLGRNRLTYTVSEPVENSQPRFRQYDEPWTPITGGTLYRLPAGENEAPSVDLHVLLSGQYRYLQVRIYNGDDVPLKFGGLQIRRIPHTLAFQPEVAGTYRLYCGNASAPDVHYDLVNFADRLRAQGVVEATLGAVTPNPLFAVETKVIPWSERYAWLLWGTLIVVLVGLGALVIRQARGVLAASKN